MTDPTPTTPAAFGPPTDDQIAASFPVENQGHIRAALKTGFLSRSQAFSLMDQAGYRLAAEGAPDGDIGVLPETRTPEQIRHDARYGIDQAASPQEISVAIPAHLEAATGGDIERLGAVVGEMQSLASDLGFTAHSGRGFLEQVMSSGAQLRGLSASEHAGLVAKWQAQILNAYQGDAAKVAGEMLKIDDLLSLTTSPLAAAVKSSGAIYAPLVWGYLAGQANRVAAWRAGRPA